MCVLIIDLKTPEAKYQVLIELLSEIDDKKKMKLPRN